MDHQQHSLNVTQSTHSASSADKRSCPAAFVAPSPLVSSLRHEKRSRGRTARCSGVRASATAGGGDRANDDADPLAESRRALERSLGSELSARAGRNGRCKCIWCEGTKERACSWCKGTGVRYEVQMKGWDELKNDLDKMQSGQAQFMPELQKVPVRCSACSGSKKLRCAYCRGSGIGSYGHAY